MSIKTPIRRARLSAGLLADFEISRIFGLTLGYRFYADLTDFGIESMTFEHADSGDITFEDVANGGLIFDPVAAPSTSYQGYMDHRVFLTLNLRY